jgi:hypothetical protein
MNAKAMFITINLQDFPEFCRRNERSEFHGGSLFKDTDSPVTK